MRRDDSDRCVSPIFCQSVIVISVLGYHYQSISAHGAAFVPTNIPLPVMMFTCRLHTCVSEVENKGQNMPEFHCVSHFKNGMDKGGPVGSKRGRRQGAEYVVRGMK